MLKFSFAITGINYIGISLLCKKGPLYRDDMFDFMSSLTYKQYF